MAGFDVPGPEVRDPATGYPVTVNKATVLRIELSIPAGKPPTITSQTVIASGFGERADQDVFLIGPTGLALAPDGTRSMCRTRSTTRSSRSPMRRRARDSAGHRPHGHQGRPAAAAAGAGADARRPSAGLQRQERPGRGGRSGDRQAALRAMDRRQPGAIAAGQRRPVRHRHDAGRQGLLLRRGRREHAGGGDAMSERRRRSARATRRGFLAATAGLARRRRGARRRRRARGAREASTTRRPPSATQTEPFWGAHQGGIVTPPQSHTYFAAFDLTTDEARRCRRAAAGLDRRRRADDDGKPIEPFEQTESPMTTTADDDGHDSTTTPARPIVAARYRRGARPAAGAADPDLRLRRRALRQGRQGPLRPRRASARGAGRPAALRRRPVGRRRTPAAICRCRPAPTIRRSRSMPSASWRGSPTTWRRSAGRRPGFIPSFGAKRDAAQPDGLQGRHQQPVDRRPEGDGASSSGSATRGPDWMRGGSYLVVRRIRIALEHWDRMKVAFQEQTVGRHKDSGAPLGKQERIRPARPRRDRQGRQPGHSRERACPARRRGEQRRRADPAPALFLQ